MRRQTRWHPQYHPLVSAQSKADGRKQVQAARQGWSETTAPLLHTNHAGLGRLTWVLTWEGMPVSKRQRDATMSGHDAGDFSSTCSARREKDGESHTGRQWRQQRGVEAAKGLPGRRDRSCYLPPLRRLTCCIVTPCGPSRSLNRTPLCLPVACSAPTASGSSLAFSSDSRLAAASIGRCTARARWCLEREERGKG